MRDQDNTPTNISSSQTQIEALAASLDRLIQWQNFMSELREQQKYRRRRKRESGDNATDSEAA